MQDLFGPVALRAAVDAGVVTVEGERVRAAHPLLAAAAKRQARAEDAQELHRRLAEVVADEQRRALHLALATTEPDEELARRLDAAAARAAARGATRLAVDMGAHALRLTPPGTSDVDRVLALGRHLEDAGDKERLTELLTARVDTLPVGAARVQAYTLLTEGVVRGNADIRGLLEKALAEAGDDPTLRAQVLPFLAEHEAVDEVRQRGARRRPRHRGGRAERARQRRRPGARGPLPHVDPGPARATGRAPGGAVPRPDAATRPTWPGTPNAWPGSG